MTPVLRYLMSAPITTQCRAPRVQFIIDCRHIVAAEDALVVVVGERRVDALAGAYAEWRSDDCVHATVVDFVLCHLVDMYYYRWLTAMRDYGVETISLSSVIDAYNTTSHPSDDEHSFSFGDIECDELPCV